MVTKVMKAAILEVSTRVMKAAMLEVSMSVSLKSQGGAGGTLLGVLALLSK